MISSTLFIYKGNEKEGSKMLKKISLEGLGLSLSSLAYTETGKPYIKNSDIGISITHDDNITALLITPFTPIGIDMQIITDEYPIRVPDRFFFSAERDLISSAEDFYRIWCKKESYVKMTGEGIAGMSSFDSTNTEFIFTDLSEKISDMTQKNLYFFICSTKKISPSIISI